jgi:arsenate reductase-like glutaredoxin family protein
MTCKHAQGFLGPAGTEVKQTVDANKFRFGDQNALALLDGIDKLVAMKGKKVEVFDLRNNRPDDETLLKKLIGPSGNLRAPTARVGKTLLVGFNEEAYQEYLG